jgi:hypothetical protein
LEGVSPYSLRSSRRFLGDRQVRWWDANGAQAPDSQPAQFDTAFLSPSDWSPAVWISGFNDVNMLRKSTSLLPPSHSEQFRLTIRSAFNVTKSVARARAYICGLGYHELYLNGQKVGQGKLEPGWTSYLNRYPFFFFFLMSLLKMMICRSVYLVHDVTSMLQVGPNAVGVMLGGGPSTFPDRLPFDSTVSL